MVQYHLPTVLELQSAALQRCNWHHPAIFSLILPKRSCSYILTLKMFFTYLLYYLDKNVKQITGTLLSCCGGGKGVYSFFSFIFTFLRLTFLLLNFGKNLSQFSFFKAGSFANSLFIINI